MYDVGDESLEDFRARLKDWVEAHLAPCAGQPLTTDEKRANTQEMYDAGLLAMTWPVKYGGRGKSAEWQTTWNQVVAPVADVLLPASVTVGICAATLLEFADESQSLRHIPRMLRGDELWTQLLSEPGAGSDLASIATRGDLEADGLVIRGQKVWTSGAQDAQFGLALVRTGGEGVNRRDGLTMVIVDLRAPEIDIRPLRQMTGEAIFNEVFIDGAVVPITNVVGGFGQGWKVLRGMLRHERIALSAGTTGRRMDADRFPDLVELARSVGKMQEAPVRAALADVYIQQRLLDYLGVLIRAALVSHQDIGPVGSLGKIGTARASRAVAEAAFLIGGMENIAWPADDPTAPKFAHTLLRFPMTSIAGGTTEIQKNTVAESLLGLPRELLPDRERASHDQRGTH